MVPGKADSERFACFEHRAKKLECSVPRTVQLPTKFAHVGNALGPTGKAIYFKFSPGAKWERIVIEIHACQR